MNILLTGGTGYIGSHTAVVLSQLGHQVVLYDNLSHSSKVVLEKIEQITGRRMLFVKGDVRDTELLSNVFVSHCIDSVIHFAGLKAVGESVEKPIDYYANNVQGTVSLLQAMQSQEIKTLIFSSSATIYGQPQYLPLDENHPTSATNPYGRCKLHIEEMLNDVASSDSEWRIACLRYFNPVGAHESGQIGEDPTGIPNNLVPYLARVALGVLPILNVFGADYDTPDGTGIRDYIHVMDVAEGHQVTLNFLKQLQTDNQGTGGVHTFNLGTGQPLSVLEFVRAFEAANDCSVPYKVVDRRSGDIAASYADPSKANRLLGWKANRSVAQMCASTWHHLNIQEQR